MTGLRLALRSRRVGWVVLVLVGSAVIGRVLGPHGYFVGQQAPMVIPWSVFVPLISAYLIAATTASSVPWLDRLAHRDLDVRGWLRVGALTVLAVGLVLWSTAEVPPPLSSPAAVRDLVGLLGLSLACVASLGVAAGWLPPAGLLFGAIVMRYSDADLLPVTWLVRDDGDVASMVVAGALLIGGVTVAANRRVRERQVVRGEA